VQYRGIPFRDEFVQQVASGAGVGYLVEPDRPEARSVVDALAPVLANVLNPVPM
jgi:hypothetical protein